MDIIKRWKVTYRNRLDGEITWTVVAALTKRAAWRKARSMGGGEWAPVSFERIRP